MCVLFFREENTININRVFYYYYIRIRKILYTRRIKISILNIFLYVHHQYIQMIFYTYT